MSLTRVKHFANVVQKTEEWLNEIQDTAGLEDEEKTYLGTSAVLKTLRDRLILDEAADFASQLPMILRGIFYEGFRPRDIPKKYNKTDFLEAVREKSVDQELDPEKMSKAVFEVLSNKVTNGEIRDVKASLPKDLQELFPGSR